MRPIFIQARRRMEFHGGYVVNDAGQPIWHQGLRITDEAMKAAYRQQVLVEYVIESSAIMGVKVGMS